jgi:arylsulfatase A-like enzyme
MTERFCEEVLLKRRPTHAVLWLSEPDHTSHHFPLGSREYLAAIRHADRCVLRVLETIERIDHENSLVMVCSDHGHETIDAIVDIGNLLVKEGLKASLNSDDVLVAPNGGGALIYLSPEASSSEAEISEYLETQTWTHQVYRDDDLKSIGQCKQGSLFIAVDLKHSEKPNDFGVPGVCVTASDPTSSQIMGCGTHGGLGQYVQAPFLMVRGAEFSAGTEIKKSVSPMDIAPTILQHLGISWKDMDGTPLPPIS